MDKTRAAMQQALEALDTAYGLAESDWAEQKYSKAITALREALANSLKPRCFADYQPNHAIDRACASCAIADECRTGEQPVSQEPTIDFDKLHAMNMQYVECPACGSDMAMAYSPKQPVSQEPIAVVVGQHGGRFVIQPINPAMVLPTNMALYTAPQPVKELTENNR